ncbi:MAG: transposase [Elainella sp.]
MRPRAVVRRKGTRTKQGAVYGFDGGKKIKGCKRFILVDTLGRVISVLVVEVNCSEQRGGAFAVHEADPGRWSRCN